MTRTFGTGGNEESVHARVIYIITLAYSDRIQLRYIIRDSISVTQSHYVAIQLILI